MENLPEDGIWHVVEEQFLPQRQLLFESLFCLANGQQGHRGSVEEDCGAPGVPRGVVGGIFGFEPLPQGQRVNGLPADLRFSPDAPFWPGIQVAIDGNPLDLLQADIIAYRRTLDLRRGVLARTFTIQLPDDKRLEVESERFQSLDDTSLGCVRFAVRPLNFSGTLTLIPYLDLNGSRQGPGNGGWVEVETQVRRSHAHILGETRSTEFLLASGMKILLFRQGKPLDLISFRVHREKYVALSLDLALREKQSVELQKFCASASSLDHPRENLLERCKAQAKSAAKAGFAGLRERHAARWTALWDRADLRVEGDPLVQEGLRFSLFHLLQAFSGSDDRFGLCPRGFSGLRGREGADWTAEAFLLPFALCTLGQAPARNLLLHRYRFLPAAQEYARRLGFGAGAALYPLRSVDGEEACTDWPLALGAIHRNGAIARAIHCYLQFSGDRAFLVDHGLEMLIAIARFWVERAHFSPRKKAYVMHGVTGPDEYGQLVNNNWYTNLMGRWCLRFAARCAKEVREEDPEAFRALAYKVGLEVEQETAVWTKVGEAMYLPYDQELGIFPQHDDYLDKALSRNVALGPSDQPLHKNWSRDRVLRSGYLQRADVLQGLATFYDDFSQDEIRRNFKFYEPHTVHEAATSPGLHAFLAARLGMPNKAYEHLFRGLRYDLENAGGDTEEGLHLDGMAAAWMALVMGFGGLKVAGDRLSLSPMIPHHWPAYRFKVFFRQWHVQVTVGQAEITVEHDQDQALEVLLFDEPEQVEGSRRFQRTVPSW